ncbi:MAG: sulfate permease [Myxococcales bacterium]|nr:sulfate permease [Myxococcales bacterium]
MNQSSAPAFSMSASAGRFMPKLNRATLSGDLAAGITTAVMLIPQGMGYAMLAGLPPIYGLYSAVLPLLVYAAIGSSRQLAVGPVAMVSLLVAAGVGAVAEQGSESFILYAILLAFMVGALQLAMGIGRLGFLVNFLSHPVISGFTSAAALIIGLSQLKHLLGVDIPRTHLVHTVLLTAIERAAETNLPTFALGAGGVLVLVLMKRYAPRLPRALFVVAAGTLIVWGLGLQQFGVAIVGEVPAGLPPLALPSFDLDAMASLLPIALTISLVGFMESVAVAKRYARENGYEVDANKELVGLGMANLLGSFTSSYPTTGGFSRTAVNAQAGAKTTFASVVTALVVALTLLVLTPLFYFLPKAILAAIIMTAVFGLLDIAEVKHLWKVSRRDLFMLVLTFGSTLMLGIEEGILIGVFASLLLVAVQRLRLRGKLPGRDLWTDAEVHPEIQREGVLALRLGAQLHFGNVAAFKQQVRVQQEALDEGRAKVRALLLDAHALRDVDASGEAALREIAEECRERDILVWIAGLRDGARAILERSGLARHLGAAHLPVDLERALGAIEAQEQARMT